MPCRRALLVQALTFRVTSRALPVSGADQVVWAEGEVLDSIESSAINDAGQLVGDADTADGETHNVLWQDGQMADLGTLGGERSMVNAISNAGHIVGRSSTLRGGE